MRIIFFGTPAFAAEVFEFLFLADVAIVAVVTQPDRPRGRSQQTSFSPVKEKAFALCKTIQILQPEKSSDLFFLDQLRLIQADLFVVVAFGQILPQSLLDIPPKGCINVHASLLPRYRGAAPIQRALLHGEKKTGVCVQKMVKQLDAGDVIASAHMLIPPSMVFGELEQGLCNLSKDLLLLVLRRYEEGIPNGAPQDPALVTYAPKITPEEKEINWNLSAEAIHNQIRAFSPSPGAWCYVRIGNDIRRVKILYSKVSVGKGEPGALLDSKGVIACGNGAIQIFEIQQEGKKKMPMNDFLRGCLSPPVFQNPLL